LPEEFEELFREHYRLLYQTAYGVTGNRTDAEDVLQSLFVDLLQHGFTAELKENPAQGLHRAVVRLSSTVARANRRQRRNAARKRDPFDEPLSTAIARLKPRALEILVLHYKHDFSDAQIAALLGTSRGTIAVTLSRLRARLREVLRAAGCARDSTTRESLRELVERYVPSPSHVEMAVSRDRLERCL
jgi:RNA polymerase sigma-70 factor (ECF subfamily)